MTVSSDVCEGDWSVSVETNQAAGGFDCRIHIHHSTPEGPVEHEFKHSSIFPTEREAVLAGLREGMGWIELKMSKSLNR
ncbi:UDP-glucose 4-epimerase [Paraburkholderia sp. RL17-373-BIF-A]|uniref:UDP-glucose 4-epimerase n=1 Tax=Paraburkholderia sp. RL17-373-BIF-A TaxID=3031629 RepID=UPI0038B7060A